MAPINKKTKSKYQRTKCYGYSTDTIKEALFEITNATLTLRAEAKIYQVFI